MNRTIVNFVVDIAAFVAFLFLATTGVLMRYVLPPGSGHFSRLWGMDRHQWGAIHFWIAAALTALVVLHLYLHWRWIVSTLCGRRPERSAVRITAAVLVVLVVAGLGVSPFFTPVESRNSSPPHRLQSEKPPESPADAINGSMTLGEVEQQTGVSAAAIAKELGLPNDVPVDEKLGRLRRKYGFEMHDLREAVRKHIEQRQPQGDPP